LQFKPGIAAIGEDVPQRRLFLADGFEHVGRTVAVLNIGGMDNQDHEVPECIRDDIPFALLDLLAHIKPAAARQPRSFSPTGYRSRPQLAMPSGFSPSHRDSFSCCKPTESQPTKIAQLSFLFRLLGFAIAIMFP
jgi:hypothetical protein